MTDEEKKELSNQVKFLVPKVSIVEFGVTCTYCKDELLSPWEYDLNSEETRELQQAITTYHTKLTNHEEFILTDKVRAFECGICRSHTNSVDGFQKGEEWALNHFKDTTHRFFKFTD